MNKRFEKGVLLAEKAGDFLLQSGGRPEIFSITDYDTKLKQDIESEKIILAGIAEEFPEDGYISEEHGEKKSLSGYVWIIDPLDGTVNYSRGLPHCCVSIACRKGSESFGVVYDFYRDELFKGKSEEGAFLNGQSINVSSSNNLKEAILHFGLMKGRAEIAAGISVLSEFAPKVKKIRSMGAAALDLCYVAAGRIDLFVEVGLYPWDTAAGKIIIEEAGGRYLEKKFGSQLLSYADNGRMDAEFLSGLLGGSFPAGK